MSYRLNQSLSTSQTNRLTTDISSVIGIVVDNILDDTHPRVKEGTSYENVESLRTDLIGSSIIRPVTDSITPQSSLKSYKPINSSMIEMPLIGEMVELIKSAGTTYYKRIPNSNINVGNAIENRDTDTFDEEKSNKSDDYSTVSSTGISNTENSDSRNTKIGEYFKPTQINPLRLYEGDKIIQSRFGQSIRFSAYNNPENTTSPTIIIRNRQNDESVSNLKEGSLTEENVNKDGSTIILSSNDYKLDYQPGLIDDGGSSNFKTTPINFELPSEYVGQDQILINSERIILSSKSREMIFFSKGDYGFISDGSFKIDNGEGGADLDFGDDVNITTDRNSGNFFVNTGDGNILLNTTETEEPLVRGNTLVELLEELIDAINKQVYNTPAGPTAPGPTNRADFIPLNQN